MLSQLSYELDLFLSQSQQHIGLWLGVIACLWAFNIINWFLGAPFNRLGIIPRTPLGLIGIAFSPFLHGNFNHLFFNTIPLFILGLFILGDGLQVFAFITVFIAFFQGILVWGFGRRGNHIGASGVIAGYFGYVLATAYQSPTFTTIALCLVALYYFGGILFSIFPTDEKVSFEGHLFGLLVGISSRYALTML